MGIFFVVYHDVGKNEMTLLDECDDLKEARRSRKEYSKLKNNGNKISIVKLQEPMDSIRIRSEKSLQNPCNKIANNIQPRLQKP